MRINKKGFTLIEIIVVVTILAVLMAIAVPSILKYLSEGDIARDAAIVRGAKLEATRVYAHNEGLLKNGEVTYIYDYNNEEVIELSTNNSNAIAAIDGYGFSNINDVDGTKTGAIGIPKNNFVLVTVSNDLRTTATWGFAASNDLLTAFNKVILNNKLESFLVANSTFTKSHKSIDAVNQFLKDINSNIKTWAILSTKKDSSLYNQEGNQNFLFSEVDISTFSDWSENDRIPAIMQTSDGMIEVGMAVLKKQTDGAANQPYYVIFQDINGRSRHYADNDTFLMNTVIREDEKKQIFTNMNDAYAYYKTLQVEKQPKTQP